MKTMCVHSIPVFLGNAGIGLPHGMVPPQIRGFDVFYKFPVIIGFHVLGSPEYACPDLEVIPQELYLDNAPKIVGFYCFGSGGGECCQETNFSVSVVQGSNTPKIFGFYAFAVSDDTLKDIGLLAQIVASENSPKLLGFYAIGVT